MCPAFYCTFPPNFTKIGIITKLSLVIEHTAHWAEMLNLVWKLFLMISCLDMIFFHTTGLLRHQGFQENWKKANKGRKGRTKGQRAKNVKFLDFLVVLGLFGVNNAMISLFLSFMAMKAKKAAIVAGKAKLQTGKFVEPKILS